jgi:hypothetical protein
MSKGLHALTPTRLKHLVWVSLNKAATRDTRPVVGLQLRVRATDRARS